MSIKRILVGLLVIVVLAGAFVAPSVNAAPPAKAEWRYLVYLLADNNLDVETGPHHTSVVEDDFDELMSVGSTDEVVCYVFVDRWTGPANLFKVMKGEMIEMTDFAFNGIEANMGDPATLRSFVEYTYDAAPAERTVLMFWDHGSPNIIGWDDNGPAEGVGDALTHHEVLEALDGYRVDVMGADECLVGQVEVAYEYAVGGLDCDYLLASETYTGWRGYPYDQTFARLVADPSMDARECAIMFIEEVSLLLSQPPYMSEAINDHAAIDLETVKDLGASLKELSELLVADPVRYASAITSAKGDAIYSYGANSADLIDLRDFVAALGKSSSLPKEIKDACADVLEDFDETIVALQVWKPLLNKVNGLGVLFAMHEWEVPDYYYEYVMPNEFWLAFLESYWSAVGGK